MDLIEAENGDFIIAGNINSAFPLIENPYTRNYWVRTNSIGDTIWTKTELLQILGPQLVEKNNGNIASVGSAEIGFLCGQIGTGWPFTDFSVQTYDPNGNQLSIVNTDVECGDGIRDARILSDGSILTLNQSSDINWVYSYGIGRLDVNGVWSIIPIPSYTLLHIDAAPNGYWMARHNRLFKFDNSGQNLWEVPMPFVDYITDFCAVENDSLVFTYASNNVPDSSYVIKTDSIGNYSWSKQCDYTASSVFMHSSGNYIVSGSKNGDTLVTRWYNPQGDSIWGTDFHMNEIAHSIKSIELNNGGTATLAMVGANLGRQQIAVARDPGPYANSEELSLATIPLKVFPNPSTGRYQIESPISVQWCVTTIDGQLVRTGNGTEIDLSEQPDGIYLLHCFNEFWSITKNLVLKR